ncbi:Crp/Fnr family transcriptional regulator [Aquimarina sp. ERC-38]|uniref:Crp/Fnr family transcriptional regulator n=1 Tax=Aquimarina sp. ERC-38 TaxID=2949996 RepID=UPI002246EE38|nr:Crp/Fnr family transcriptional regulator [Aquimarina sp. ERC-38]UZO80161.1 Crp/Fnr family transcriptional regulator [Aquimarina sp. ERC-38]
MKDSRIETTLTVVRNYLEKFSSITDSDWEFFSSRLIPRQIAKKTTFLKLNSVESTISFIVSGMVRLYIPESEDSKEITFGFSFQEQFISAYDSFLTRTPSQYELQTLTDTSLLTMTYENLQEVYKTTQIGNLIGRLTAERLFLIKSKREQTLLQNTAEERYLNIFKYHPEMIQRIPLKYISSYIGVTPQALSRIRKKIT